MHTLPQLIEEDIHSLNASLQELIEKCDCTTALVIDVGGFLITNQGDSGLFDLTSIAALASGAYMANQTIATFVSETNFNSVYQQGQKHSIFVMSVDEYCMLVVIFKTQVKVGAVKYFSGPAVAKIAQQLQVAHERDPERGLDLSILNQADTSDVFKARR